MNDERAESGASQLSWLDRLTAALTGEPKTRQQLLDMLRDAEDRNLFDAEALSMMEGVLQVAEMRVRDIMVPRAQMVVIEEDEPPEEFVKTVIDSAHSRFPVLGDNRDEVEGILLAKDLLAYFATQDQDEFDLRDAMRPVVYVPESKRLNVLLSEFRASRNHMAIVVDEYGGVAGLVTIEDVLEQIVGEIDDEHDSEEERYIKERSTGEYLIKALTPIEDFNEYFEVNLNGEEFDTIGGLVIKSFGHLPSRGERTVFGDFEFEIIRADKRRVHLVQMRRLPVE
ncbi:MAG: magnesium/cobalt efflux protein [Gammaproteobacteria bacterium]|nr:magnesium/cobalt efflux protein [Gammaproteobacteria bacterium]|tara:strand:+ start:1004 stop:1852 length:849 start_codon:yes stop_codon:yes gene_type:complete